MASEAEGVEIGRASQSNAWAALSAKVELLDITDEGQVRPASFKGLV